MLAIAALALGIGLTAALFTILRGSLWRDLPFPHAERLVRIERSGPQGEGVVAAELEVWRSRQAGLSEIVAWFGVDLVFSGDGQPADSYHGAYISSELFEAVGLWPAAGRAFRPDEDVAFAPSVVILGHELWSTRYGRDPGIVGKSVRLGGEPATIIGVMPPGFRFPVQEDYWIPLGTVLAARSAEAPLEVFGRLREGVGPGRVQKELDLLAKGVEAPGREGWRTLVHPFVESYTSTARRPLFLMLGAALSVLVLSCLHVSHLLSLRALRRTGELAIRRALGAGRKNIASTVLAEALLLALAGGAMGLGLAAVLIEAYEATGGLVQAFWVELRFDPVVLGLIAALMLLVAVFSGGLPAWRSARQDVGSVLRQGAPSITGVRRRGGVGSSLAVQIALTSAVLVGAAQMVESVRKIDGSDVGDRPDRIWTALLMVDPQNAPDPESWNRFYEELLLRVRTLPGVDAAALASHLPGAPAPRKAVEIEGLGSREPRVYWSAISPELFQLLRRPLLRGRGLERTDAAGAPKVVLVNQSFATANFASQGPLGRRIRLRDSGSSGSWATIVGVVPDLYLDWSPAGRRIEAAHAQGIYGSLRQRPLPGTALLVRTDLPEGSIESSVRRVLKELDPDVPLLRPQMLADRLAEQSIDYRMVRNLFSLFGGAALVLTALGIYGTISSQVGQRRKEIALRIALGATAERVIRSTAGGSLVQIAAGVIVGMGLAILLSRFLRSLLFGVQPVYGPTFTAAATIVLVIAGVACLVPLHRAIYKNPGEILDSE